MECLMVVDLEVEALEEEEEEEEAVVELGFN